MGSKDRYLAFTTAVYFRKRLGVTFFLPLLSADPHIRESHENPDPGLSPLSPKTAF